MSHRVLLHFSAAHLGISSMYPSHMIHSIHALPYMTCPPFTCARLRYSLSSASTRSASRRALSVACCTMATSSLWRSRSASDLPRACNSRQRRFIGCTLGHQDSQKPVPQRLASTLPDKSSSSSSSKSKSGQQDQQQQQQEEEEEEEEEEQHCWQLVRVGKNLGSST